MGSISHDDRGIYRWVYELDLLRNPTIFMTVMKVLAIATAALLAFLFSLLVPDILEGSLHAWEIEGLLRTGAAILAIMACLGLLGYAAYAIMAGRKYCVVFTMDEKGVTHRQLPRQFSKAQVVNGLNVLAGLAAGNLSQMGLGMLASSRDSMTTDFANVRSVKGSRSRQVIKVREGLAGNQVYVEPEDYDFVLGYIVERCPNAKTVQR